MNKIDNYYSLVDKKIKKLTLFVENMDKHFKRSEKFFQGIKMNNRKEDNNVTEDC